jgi:iron(II)-dependent oxidoreductase
LPGEQRLPVVGVSWYEAWAYARWVGKRLPTDSEWTKAGAWPVESSPGRIAQRRYPWGESFDVRRAHLYGSGNQTPVAVDEYPGGTSVGGIQQLIGNVWEWTSTPLVELGDPTLHVSESVMSIRGGAFDTYFENQATCHYQSGEHPLARRPNIGFRLALPMQDLEVVNEDDAPGGVVDEPVAEESETTDVVATC